MREAFVATDVALMGDVLCVQEEWIVARDNTDSACSEPPIALRAHYVKASCAHHDGSLAVFHVGARSSATPAGQLTAIKAVRTAA